MSERPPAPEYLIRHEGRTFGPYAREDLEAAARGGKITWRDEISDADHQHWTHAQHVEWLRGPRGRRLAGPGAPRWTLVVAGFTLLAVVALFVIVALANRG